MRKKGESIILTYQYLQYHQIQSNSPGIDPKPLILLNKVLSSLVYSSFEGFCKSAGKERYSSSHRILKVKDFIAPITASFKINKDIG